jgi:hypothetical protein
MVGIRGCLAAEGKYDLNVSKVILAIPLVKVMIQNRC